MPTKKLRTIAVIFGGRTPEHEVSIVSARSVIEGLKITGNTVVPIGITKEGQWLLGSEAQKLLEGAAPDMEHATEGTILPVPIDGTFASSVAPRIRTLKSLDVVFPVIHGPLGEDGSLQGLFELANLPYVGANVLGSAVGMDKAVMKRLFIVAGLPVAEFITFVKGEWLRDRRTILKELSQLTYPLFVKPANMGSSVGISKVHDHKQLAKAIALALTYDRKVLVEKALKGARDIECSVVGNDFPKSSIPGEVVSSNEFYDYDAKYVDGKTETRVVDDLPKEKMQEIQETAIKAYKTLNCEGMARVDFLLAQDGTLYLNELNTIPGFTSISMYPKLWEASGLSQTKLLDKLIDLAIERFKKEKKLKTTVN
ncbi:MAG TPA: D-alanine--D-alanine ligase A [Candidatus Kerfeldbacteria bacterium]|nr:D-alanine--D-alanine ligase A [Candidatus Kerfeldbacteria bacterium]